MKTVVIDYKNVNSKNMLHSRIKRQLNLPSYYGYNLDALYDIITEYDEKVFFSLINLNCLEDYNEEFKEYYSNFFNMLVELEQDGYIEFRINSYYHYNLFGENNNIIDLEGVLALDKDGKKSLISYNNTDEFLYISDIINYNKELLEQLMKMTMKEYIISSVKLPIKEIDKYYQYKA